MVKISIKPSHYNWEIFKQVSKVIRECIGLASLCSVIGPRNSHHPLNQSDTQPKPITAWSPAFSRALGSLPAFTLSPDWLFNVFSFLLIGRYDYLLALICKEQKLLQSKNRPKSNLDGKDEFRPSFVKPNPKQTQRTKGSKQRKNANQLKLTFYLMLWKTQMTKSLLVLALNLVGLEEVGTSKSEILHFSFECLSASFRHYLALWLVQKTRAYFPTNQMQN